MIDDGWRLTDHSVEAAMTRGQMWLTGAARALQGARDGGAIMWALHLETSAFVSAVHHLRTCAVMAQTHAKHTHVPAHLKAALKSFDAAVRGLVSVRNTLEHFEEYVLGLGNEQQTDVKPVDRLPDEAKAQKWRIVPDYADAPDCVRPTLMVGPYLIDLVGAYKAASDLLAAIYTAAQLEAGDIELAAPEISGCP